MGLRFAAGQGVAQDYAQAVRWYAQAAEHNHSLAQLNLAMLYGQGLGVVRHEAKSRLWAARAAKLGNATAQYNLGVQQHLSPQSHRMATASRPSPEWHTPRRGRPRRALSDPNQSQLGRTIGLNCAR
jgi:hypothetical protein